MFSRLEVENIRLFPLEEESTGQKQSAENVEKGERAKKGRRSRIEEGDESMLTELAFILDRSGSMYGLEQDAIGAMRRNEAVGREWKREIEEDVERRKI